MPKGLLVNVDGKKYFVPDEPKRITVGSSSVSFPNKLSTKARFERAKFEAALMDTNTYRMFKEKGQSHDQAISNIVGSLQNKGFQKKGRTYFDLKNLPATQRKKNIRVIAEGKRYWK